MRKKVVLLAVATLLFAVPVSAHEEGVVKLSAQRAEPGGGLGLRGQKMPKSATVKLELRGTLVTLSLGELKTDTAGVFESKIVVPETAEPGNYQLVVVAADGDVVARADLAVHASAPAAAREDHAGMGHEEMASTEATAEMMPLEAPFSTAETSVIGVLIVAGLAGGLFLLRRPCAA